jgi:hypothetical protein
MTETGACAPVPRSRPGAKVARPSASLQAQLEPGHGLRAGEVARDDMQPVRGAQDRERDVGGDHPLRRELAAPAIVVVVAAAARGVVGRDPVDARAPVADHLAKREGGDDLAVGRVGGGERARPDELARVVAHLLERVAPAAALVLAELVAHGREAALADAEDAQRDLRHVDRGDRQAVAGRAHEDAAAAGEGDDGRAGGQRDAHALRGGEALLVGRGQAGAQVDLVVRAIGKAGQAEPVVLDAGAGPRLRRDRDIVEVAHALGAQLAGELQADPGLQPGMVDIEAAEGEARLVLRGLRLGLLRGGLLGVGQRDGGGSWHGGGEGEPKPECEPEKTTGHAGSPREEAPRPPGRALPEARSSPGNAEGGWSRGAEGGAAGGRAGQGWSSWFVGATRDGARITP